MGVTIKSILGVVKTVSPWFDTGWILIPGIGTASAYADLDAFGTLFELTHLPKRGIFISARLLDLDDEGTNAKLEVHCFRERFTPTADNSALAITDADVRYGYECSISIDNGYDNNTSFFVVKDDLRIQFFAPRRRLYAQCQTRGAPNIAAGSEPLVRLQGIVLEP